MDKWIDLDQGFSTMGRDSQGGRGTDLRGSQGKLANKIKSILATDTIHVTDNK